MKVWAADRILYNHHDALFFGQHFINRSVAPVAKTPDGLWLWMWSSFTAELQSGHSMASTPSLSAVFFGKPGAGSNEQYAGEGIFLTQRRDL